MHFVCMLAWLYMLYDSLFTCVRVCMSGFTKWTSIMATIHPVMCALIPKSGGTIHVRIRCINQYQGKLSLSVCNFQTCTRRNYTYTCTLPTPVPKVTIHTRAPCLHQYQKVTIYTRVPCLNQF